MIEALNTFEVSLITKFKSHLFFSNIDSIVWQDFLNVLIQRRFLSLSIVNLYEFVIDALTDEQIKRTVREILSEEFPRNTKGVPLPSHRELLFQDLRNLGATSEMILTTPETLVTKSVRDESYQYMVSCLGKEYCQVGLVAFLRFWAEVLVSVEYSCLWQQISLRLSNEKSPHKIRSEFYYFHMVHDSRNSDIGQESILGGLTHSQELAIHLKQLIVSEEALAYCLNLQEHAYQLKCQFYDQFIRDPLGCAENS
ncbi:MAG: iron-containing redox enzyme family protein [Thermosynechococcaceae cyanobacterium MS004]|nr:iron-containing redox enzyme family protein [Thermosynechococcaceae cyanobacterium MS004]